jgi:hypothetical protein
LELCAAALDALDQRLAAAEPLAAYSDGAAWLGRLREDHHRWLSRAGAIEAELGRTPASRAKLSLHLASAQREHTRAELLDRYSADVEVDA